MPRPRAASSSGLRNSPAELDSPSALSAHEAEAHEASAHEAAAAEPLAQEAEAQDAEAQLALAQEADAQLALAQDALPQDASAAALAAHEAESKTFPDPGRRASSLVRGSALGLALELGGQGFGLRRIDEVASPGGGVVLCVVRPGCARPRRARPRCV